MLPTNEEESRGGRGSRVAGGERTNCPITLSSPAPPAPPAPPASRADTVGSYEQATVDNLRNWYSAVDKLGKSEEYKNRIVEVATEFKSGQGLSDRMLIAMNKDMEELRSINRLTQISQRVCDVLGQPGEGGSIEVVGKAYDISLNSSQKDLTISQKNGDVILDIKSGKIQNNQVSPDIMKNFEDINAKLDTAMARLKSEYLEM